MKVEQASPVEPQYAQTTVNSSSGASTYSSKVSKFGVKSGFVIPKNKLSGSLVPIFRGAKKVDNHDPSKEENNKQVQRKTKWGTDLTQDASVRQGRALAYQTRVEQIAQQLKSGVLKIEEELGPQSPTEDAEKEYISHQVDDQLQKLEALELEKREAIGEILKLNPSYKAPADYKPLLKEAKVPIPFKLYPGFNFINLLLGLGSNTQKRLEEETGAKVRVQGTKAGEKDKGEVTLSNGNEDQSAYEELFVHVSADSFEKVDAAVALIELLVTPVSGVLASTALVSGDSTNVMDQSQDAACSYALPAALVNPGGMQPIMGPTQPGFLQGQFQPYTTPWYTQGPPPPSFGLPPNSSLPMPNNSIQFPSSSFNPSRMSPNLIGRPPFGAGFGLVPRNPSLVSPRPQPPLHGLQPMSQPPNQVSHMRGHQGPQSPLAYPTFSAQGNPALPHQFTSNQPRNIGPGQPFSMTQPMSGAPSGPPTNQSFASARWPTSASNVTQVASSMATSQIIGQSSSSMVSPSTYPSQLFTQWQNTAVNRPVAGPTFSSVSASGAPIPSPSVAPSQASGVVNTPSSMAPPAPISPNTYPRGGAPPAPNQSLSATSRPIGPQGPVPNLSVVVSAPVIPPMPLASPRPQGVSPVTTPKPQRPSSGDFTFQPIGSHNTLASQMVVRPSDPHGHTSAMQTSPMVQAPTLQSPSFRPAMQNVGSPQQLIRGFPSSRPVNQFGQPQVQVPPPSPGSVVRFSGNQSSMGPPPRLPPFPNQNPLQPTPSGPYMRPPQMLNLPGPTRMTNQPQQQNQISPIRPGNGFFPNQQFNNPSFSSGRRPVSSPGGNQVYDPFSPTSISSQQDA